MRLLGYARQSKSDRDRVPSTEWQLAEVGRWAEARGDEILAQHADVDTSGFRKVARPGFEALLEGLASPAVDGVVVWRLDRLSRQGQWGPDVIRFMEAKGPKVLLSVLEDIDTSTAAGELVLGVRLSLAKSVSEGISQQWRRQKRDAAVNGAPASGGHRWFGWTRDLQLDPVESGLLRDAAKRILANGSLRAVVLDWTERGVLTSTGRPFTSRSLRQTMRSYRLAGLREYDGDLIPGTWPEILDLDTVARLRALLDDPARRTAGAPVRTLLGGLARCGLCETRLRASKTVHGVRRYGCPAPPDGCGRLTIVAAMAESAVQERVGSWLSDPAIVRAVAEWLERDRPDLSEVRDELARVDADLARLAERLARRELLEVEHAAARRELVKRHGELTTALRAVGPAPLLDPETLLDAWRYAVDSGDVPGQRAVIEALARVTVKPGRGDRVAVGKLWTARTPSSTPGRPGGPEPPRR